MGRPDRVHLPVAGQDELLMVVTDDGSRTLKKRLSGETWHSESGALSESQKVFIENGRLATLLENQSLVRVLETGFGTGLNFWLAASCATNANSKLEYVSYEPNLLTDSVIRGLEHDLLAPCQPGWDDFAEQIFAIEVDGSQILLETRFVKLKIILQCIHLEQISQPFDIVFHDPFGPESAPHLWEANTIQSLYDGLKPGGRLVTYCVKSKVQRTLNGVGFIVDKTLGPLGGKREVLVASRPM